MERLFRELGEEILGDEEGLSGTKRLFQELGEEIFGDEEDISGIDGEG